MTIEDLVAQHATLVAYLKSKVAIADWHAVSDSAVDLREIEARLEVLRDVTRSPAEVEALSEKWASRLDRK